MERILKDLARLQQFWLVKMLVRYCICQDSWAFMEDLVKLMLPWLVTRYSMPRFLGVHGRSHETNATMISPRYSMPRFMEDLAKPMLSWLVRILARYSTQRFLGVHGRSCETNATVISQDIPRQDSWKILWDICYCD